MSENLSQDLEVNSADEIAQYEANEEIKTPVREVVLEEQVKADPNVYKLDWIEIENRIRIICLEN